MSLKASVSIRFSPEIHERLNRIAQATGLKSADIVRRATEEFMDECEAAGHLIMPLNRLQNTAPVSPARKKK